MAGKQGEKKNNKKATQVLDKGDLLFGSWYAYSIVCTASFVARRGIFRPRQEGKPAHLCNSAGWTHALWLSECMDWKHPA